MQKELKLSIVVTVLTLMVVLAALRIFAPHLLGLSVPIDLQVVQVAKEVPPFYNGIFREEDRNSSESMIQDPYIKRQKPLYPNKILSGPHDLLGFRNDSVPSRPDIIAIGDSQTYGLNASMEQSWPFQLKENLKPAATVIYSMAASGWGGIEYLEIFKKAAFFSPKLIIVAFYMGNDPAETFRMVYGDLKWKQYRLEEKIVAGDYPAAAWPPPPNEQEFLRFRDGQEIGFTPKVRHISSLHHPAVDAAFTIMGNLADEMGKIARKEKFKVIFTIIPSKELVLAKRVELDKVQASNEYTSLIRDEAERIAWLGNRFGQIEGATYVNLAGDLQELALGGKPLYLATSDGHPVAEGYGAISRLLTPAVDRLLGFNQNQGDPEEQRILKGISPTRENGKRLLQLAQSYAAVNNLEQAIYVYDRYLALVPDDVEAWSLLSASWFQNGDSAKAFAAAENALRIDPLHEKTLFNKAVFYLNSNEKAKGLAILSEITARNPKAVDPNGAYLSSVIEQLRR